MSKKFEFKQHRTKYDDYQDEMAANPDAYGTPDSILLKHVREQGFKPIGITVMMCEETFIFKGQKEAKEAWEMFKPEGWWYGLSDFWKDWEDYHKQMGNHNREEVDDAIHWLDPNFKPK
jgi:hypothetical protein